MVSRWVHRPGGGTVNATGRPLSIGVLRMVPSASRLGNLMSFLRRGAVHVSRAASLRSSCAGGLGFRNRHFPLVSPAIGHFWTDPKSCFGHPTDGCPPSLLTTLPSHSPSQPTFFSPFSGGDIRSHFSCHCPFGKSTNHRKKYKPSHWCWCFFFLEPVKIF